MHRYMDIYGQTNRQRERQTQTYLQIIRQIYKLAHLLTINKDRHTQRNAKRRAFMQTD